MQGCCIAHAFSVDGTETMIFGEKEGSRIRTVQMDNLRGLLGIRRMDRVPNAQIRELCGVTKDVDERINKSVLGLKIKNY